ncbi:MAG: anti-sigma factor, partial [Planctomycetes bacterium]|nr:anti-sigma factor [Planctomycetota bacterium]
NYTPRGGSDYELWVIRDGEPRSLGVVRPDDEGRLSILVGDFGTPAAFALSREPAGGARGGPPTTVLSVGAVPG